MEREAPEFIGISRNSGISWILLDIYDPWPIRSDYRGPLGGGAARLGANVLVSLCSSLCCGSLCAFSLCPYEASKILPMVRSTIGSAGTVAYPLPCRPNLYRSPISYTAWSLSYTEPVSYHTPWCSAKNAWIRGRQTSPGKIIAPPGGTETFPIDTGSAAAEAARRLPGKASLLQAELRHSP